MKIPFKLNSYPLKLTYIILGAVIAVASLLFTSFIVRQLTQKEMNEVRLWSHAMTMVSENATPSSLYQQYENQQFNRLVYDIIDHNSIPSIITDDNLHVIKYTNIDSEVINSKRRFRLKLEKLSSLNEPIEVDIFGRGRYYIFYGESTILQILRIFPYLQLGIVLFLALLIYISYRSTKEDEQKRVWIGMAKETAHQLGTPTSSLLGWLEFLKEQNGDPFVIEEMGKDITQLLKVVDRFSKIGSQSVLEPRNIGQLVGNAVNYFKVRIPKNVELTYNQIDSTPIQAMVGETTFEWVIENLLKNALDALHGKGTIVVSVYQNSKNVYIDVKDSGKGIPKSNFKTIFSPGFTTKTRGWGLGLSLSKRIIDNHGGNIFVAESEVDKGSTMRIILPKL